MRAMASAVLALESVVLFLSTTVMTKDSSVTQATALFLGLGLAVAALVVCMLLRYRWGYVAGTLVQVAAIALGFVVTTMFLLGVIFAVLWGAALVLGRRVEAAKAQRAG